MLNVNTNWAYFCQAQETEKFKIVNKEAVYEFGCNADLAAPTEHKYDLSVTLRCILLRQMDTLIIRKLGGMNQSEKRVIKLFEGRFRASDLVIISQF